ncbi:MAG: hypothetical protein ABSA97_13940 [Verrucomicrobiia bacterium]
MTTKRTNKLKQWPPIHELTYSSGRRGWQVCCMVQGRRIREAYPTREQAEARAAQIRQMVDNEGAAAFTLPADARVEAGKCIEKLTPFNTTIAANVPRGPVRAGFR